MSFITNPLKKNRLLSGCICLIALLAGCKDDTENPDSKDLSLDRRKLLEYYADSLVIPAYAAYKTDFDLFKQKADAFTALPDASGLADLRAAWVNAYIQWQTVELFDFGPAETYTLRNLCNIYPADTTGIQNNFSNPGVNLDVPAAYPQQGFPALDYLLNGVALGDAAIVAYYKHPTEGPKRLAYLRRLVDRMESLLNQVISDWNGSYKNTFITKTGLDLTGSTSLMVNGYVLHYERFIRSGKIGIPSGVMVNGIAAPEKVEAYYKRDISGALAQSAHNAFVDFFNGRSILGQTEGLSLKTYLNALDAKDQSSGSMLSSIINTQFNAVQNGLNSLKPDYYTQITEDNQKMKDVFDQMQAAVRMLKVDMTSAMSITITYTDNDGD